MKLVFSSLCDDCKEKVYLLQLYCYWDIIKQVLQVRYGIRSQENLLMTGMNEGQSRILGLLLLWARTDHQKLLQDLVVLPFGGGIFDMSFWGQFSTAVYSVMSCIRWEGLSLCASKSMLVEEDGHLHVFGMSQPLKLHKGRKFSFPIDCCLPCCLERSVGHLEKPVAGFLYSQCLAWGLH